MVRLHLLIPDTAILYTYSFLIINVKYHYCSRPCMDCYKKYIIRAINTNFSFVSNKHILPLQAACDRQNRYLYWGVIWLSIGTFDTEWACLGALRTISALWSSCILQRLTLLEKRRRHLKAPLTQNISK